MTNAADEYASLIRCLLDGRSRGVFAEGTPGEAREDAILEQMDIWWWQMTEAEQRDAEEGIAESRRIVTPVEIGAVDVAVEVGAREVPRRAA